MTGKDYRDTQPTDAVPPGILPELPRGIRLVAVSGPDRGREITLEAGTYFIGKAATCEMPLTDPAVSRRHLEVVVLPNCLQLRDLGSTNGSYFQGARFETIRVGLGAAVTLGQTEVRVLAPDAPGVLPPSSADRFGDLLGISGAMRHVFAVLERVAPAETAVLVQGETGTGKELCAEAIHSHSPRAGGPFVICDLGAVPSSLIESELFGHVRGAFTGADRDREGAFAQADGGTIFLDEIGELDPDMQPRLLRALERRQIKPVGSSTYRTVVVRVVAATNQDLLAEVKTGRFREDLYHRLAVIRVVLPPLRERREDIPHLVEHFLRRAAAAIGRLPPLVPPMTMAALTAHDWPGNVRELRNVLERALSLAPEAEALDAGLLGLEEATPRPMGVTHTPVDPSLQFKEAKERLVQAWEHDYLVALLDRAGGNVSLASRRAGIDRVYLHRLMKKHGLGG